MTSVPRTREEIGAEQMRVEARLLDHIKVMLDRDRAPTQHEWDDFKRNFDGKPQVVAYRLANRLYAEANKRDPGRAA